MRDFKRPGVVAGLAALWALALGASAQAATIGIGTETIGGEPVKYLGAVGRDGVADQLNVFQDGPVVKFSAYFGEDEFQQDADLPAGCKRATIGGAFGRQVDCDLTKTEEGIQAIALAGLGGADKLSANSDPATAATVPVLVFGGAGNDELAGGQGSLDLLFGDAGDDRFTDTPGADLIDAGDGADSLFSGYTDEGDVFDGGAGVDAATFARSTPFTVTLNGRADDGVEGEKDNVSAENLSVQGGGATLIGDDGPNTLSTEIFGGEKGLKNRFEGLGGNDRLLGGAGTDELLGGDGDDELRGNDDNDALDGGPGKDDFVGDTRSDQRIEAPGADVIQARDGIAEAIDCGGGADSVVADPSDIVAAGCEAVDRGPTQAGPSVTPTPTATVTATPTPTPSGKLELGRRGIGLAKPARDKEAPYSFALSGKLDAPRGRCDGARIELEVLRGKKVVKKATAKVGKNCAWKATVGVGRRAGTYRLRARFTGGVFLGAGKKPTTATLKAG